MTLNTLEKRLLANLPEGAASLSSSGAGAAPDDEHVPQPPSGPERDSLPGTIEFIRALLVAQVSPHWQKLFVTARLAGESALNVDCACSVRDSDDRLPLALGDAAALSAVLLELRVRMREEIGVVWQHLELEYDVDKEYTVSVRTK